MTSVNFCYWLQGYFEVAKPETIDKAQVELIQKHLSMVFAYEIDPSFGQDNETLNHIHNSNITAGGDFHLGDTSTKPGGSPLLRC